MRHRIVRVTLFVALIAVGVGEAFLFWDAQQLAAATLARDQDLDSQLDQMLADVAQLGAAQQAYVAPGQFNGPWVALVSPLSERLSEAAARVRAGAHSTEAAVELKAFAVGLDELMVVDARLRDDMTNGDQELAADLLFSEGRDRLLELTKALEAVKTAERSFRRTDAEARVTRQVSMLGGTALIWLVGLLLLIRAPRSNAAVPATGAPPSGESSVSSGTPSHSIPDALPAPSISPATDSRALPPIDLSLAAEICKDLAQVSDATLLPAMLARAADVLDASGIIIWLGAGEQLFAVTAHGYDVRMLARLGAINRDAENATAAAWRDAQLRTVAGDTSAGPAAANGAIVAPMIGHDGCRGVLAIEVRNGRQGDTTARAVASMFAAQLAAVITAWPAASVSTGPAMHAGERAS